jgi:hypothetical protein
MQENTIIGFIVSLLLLAFVMGCTCPCHKDYFKSSTITENSLCSNQGSAPLNSGDLQ